MFVGRRRRFILQVSVRWEALLVRGIRTFAPRLSLRKRRTATQPSVGNRFARDDVDELHENSVRISNLRVALPLRAQSDAATAGVAAAAPTTPRPTTRSPFPFSRRECVKRHTLRDSRATACDVGHTNSPSKISSAFLTPPAPLHEVQWPAIARIVQRPAQQRFARSRGCDAWASSEVAAPIAAPNTAQNVIVTTKP